MIITEGKTIQQVSDEIAAKLIEQDTRCLSDNTQNCKYGNDKGHHCAVGWLLPEDDKAMMQFSGGVGILVDSVNDGYYFKSLGPNEEFIKTNVHVLLVIQDMHDLSYKDQRMNQSKRLESHGIDVSAWKPWVEMGNV